MIYKKEVDSTSVSGLITVNHEIISYYKHQENENRKQQVRVKCICTSSTQPGQKIQIQMFPGGRKERPETKTGLP